MGCISDNGILITVILVLILIWILYRYITKNYDYWRKKGVDYEEAVFPLGSMPEVFLGQRSISEAFDRLYRKFNGVRFFGIIEGRVPSLVVTDPDLIKQILIKDFRYFGDRLPLPKSAKDEYIVHHLFNMSGQDWRRMRLILAPTFTSGKMKVMFSLFEKCSDQLQDFMNTKIETDPIFDVKDVLARFTMNIIASCAFGLELNSLTEKDSEFFRIGNLVLKPNLFRMIRRIWYGILPFFLKFYRPPLMAPEITNFFTKIICDTVKYREDNNINRNDFLDLLIKIRQNKNVLEEDGKTNLKNVLELKNSAGEGNDLSIEEIIAQSFVFFVAGFETSSSTATFSLYELACNQDVQEKLYLEIKEVLEKYGGKATYQALQEMTYLDCVINETLRRYASLPVLNRTCTETYKIPDSKLVLEKGTRITIPLFSIHHDSKYYSEPLKFDPERFSPENMKKRHPCIHMPFGEGPRMCIGMRFGIMQTKIALVTMVHNYKVDVTPETEIPVLLSKKSFTTAPEKPLILEINKRK